ncbi:hypothetical protein A2716_04200 [candidate division WWE3 bacterium RIFCSPHIGHO2_01_FULL_40_23]|uniref:tRNA dimethylallyltransferase n=1 Tax=candidate division WWE3 bacterium RIFCSPLOWO2_01_FULL_41_18 TaxID=1802625 RepID=A0A1F4VCV2_UNCKA|nr:MAG: hypothetical protein A2716_04200 [candidate division WWE3 bacterium RIFCSPHIGHO2_01_FULL_40_23]OGC55076.1 MAG: hypothetical protein A3A78_03810 [candidate division WWE3 bacterium RIFCSPLOWO2_01_FULL_41_18]
MPKALKPKQVVILGPTSSGKTSLALKLCKKLGGEIVSVDSRQIYKYMDIGTGKLPVGEPFEVEKNDGLWVVNGVKVFGYNLISPDKSFSAFDFYNFISKLKFEKPYVFFTGGTGFYFDVILGNKKVANVSPDENLRKKLNKLTAEQLFLKLSVLNKEKAGLIDKNNKVRLIRAIEIETGSQNFVEKALPFIRPSVVIGLKIPRPEIYKRVDRWVETSFEALIEETKALIEMGFSETAPMKGLNYKTAVLFLSQKLNKQEALERMKYDNHKYIRRQETYFKKMPKVSFFDPLKAGFDSLMLSLVESG